MNKTFKGLGVALITPFDRNGEVDYASLGRLVDYVSDGGVDYLVVMGTTAETPTLSAAEKQSVLDCVRMHNSKKLPLIVGIGGNNTREVARMIRESDLEGVDAVLSVTPYYNKPSQRGLYEHYKYIAEASPRPIVLYNVPSRTGVNMLAETTLRLAHDVKNIVAVKEACGKIEQIKEIIAGRPDGFQVVSGDDGMALEMIREGGDGLISVAANAYPTYFAQMIHKQFEGEYELTTTMWANIHDAVGMLFAEGNPAGIKAALAAKNMICNSLRLPLTPVSDELFERMKAEIAEKKL